jgi:hypothetical protein
MHSSLGVVCVRPLELVNPAIISHGALLKHRPAQWPSRGRQADAISVDPYAHRNALREMHPREEWVDRREIFLVGLCIWDIDTTRDTCNSTSDYAQNSPMA